MITPIFTLSQDANFVYFVIKAPYAKLSEAEVFVEDDEFKFYAKPYFLRLLMPAPLVDDDHSNCIYNADTGEYEIKISKAKPGTHFEDLDMLTKLLSPKKPEVKQPLIEVLHNDSSPTPSNEIDEDFDWHFPQEIKSVDESLLRGCGYGFANQKSGIFAKLQDDVKDVIQLTNPEQSSLEERRKERQRQEDAKFDDDCYLCDLFENDNIDDLLKVRPPWLDSDNSEDWTDSEKSILKDLPNREYLLDKTESQSVYLGLVDILFSYAYNWRVTQGDFSVESAWNIRTLSFTLAWCDTCTDIRDTLRTCYRRALAFPLYRHWKLSKACQTDTARILSCSKKIMLRCLLDIYKLFQDSDPYYLLNDLYIRDYCIWIQKADSKALKSLSKAIQDLELHKGDVGYELVELEQAATLVLQEEGDQNLDGEEVLSSEHILNKFEELKL